MGYNAKRHKSRREKQKEKGQCFILALFYYSSRDLLDPIGVYFKILEQQTLPQIWSILQSLCLFENHARAACAPGKPAGGSATRQKTETHPPIGARLTRTAI